jgi:hypothetical protein
MAILGSLVIPYVVLLGPSPGPTATPTPSPSPAGQLARVATQLGERQDSAPLWLVLLTGVMGLLIAFGFKAFWHLDTVAHEGSHAVAAALLGGTVVGVEINRDGSGGTKHRSRRGSLPMIAFVGYIGSSIFGLIGAALLGSDRVVATLAIATVLTALLLLNIRNLFGWVVGLLTFGALAAVTWSSGLALQQIAAYTLIWFLLGVGMPVLIGLQRGRRKMTKVKRRKSGSDVDALRAMTGVPGVIWVWLQFAVCLFGLYLGARLMLF